MEKPWWAHGRPDHQRGASHAPRGVPRGPKAGSVERDISLWRCLRPAGDALRSQPGKTCECTSLLASVRFVRLLLGSILSVCPFIDLHRRRGKAVRYVTAPWLTCVVPPCCGVQVRGWCVLPPCVTWKRFARSWTRPGPSVLSASAHWPSPACHAATGLFQNNRLFLIRTLFHLHLLVYREFITARAAMIVIVD